MLPVLSPCKAGGLTLPRTAIPRSCESAGIQRTRARPKRLIGNRMSDASLHLGLTIQTACAWRSAEFFVPAIPLMQGAPPHRDSWRRPCCVYFWNQQLRPASDSPILSRCASSDIALNDMSKPQTSSAPCLRLVRPKRAVSLVRSLGRGGGTTPTCLPLNSVSRQRR